MSATESTSAGGRNLPAGVEVRGFALYVGLSEHANSSDATLAELVSALKKTVSERAPAAQTHATVALAPHGSGGRDVDVVRLALGEPEAVARAGKQSADRDSKAQKSTGVTVDLTRKRVTLDDVEAALTYREFDLLKYLVLREGLTVPREEILTNIWAEADGEEVPNARTVDVHVRRLRMKLGDYPEIIRTVRGGGYRFDRHADVHVLYPVGRGHDIV